MSASAEASAQGAARVDALLDKSSKRLNRDLRRFAAALNTAPEGEGATVEVPDEALRALRRIRAYYRGLRRRIEETSGAGAYGRDAVKALELLDGALEQTGRVLSTNNTFPRNLARRSLRNVRRASRELEDVHGRLQRRKRRRRRR